MNRSSQRVCGWAGDDPLMRGYHDKEWGVPVHDDRRLFEFLTLWRFVNGKPLQNRRRSLREVPARTPVSDALSVDLRKRGFRFVGSTIVYAFIQAVGMMNDHELSCYRQRELARRR